MFYLVTILFFLTQNSFANIDEDISKIQSAKTTLTKMDQLHRREMASLYSINSDIKKASHKVNRLNDEMFVINSDAKEVAKSVAQLEKVIGRQRRLLAKRLRNIYIIGGESFFRVIFGSQSVSELDRNLKYIKALSKRDVRLIKKYNLNAKLYENKKTKLNKKVKELLVVKKNLNSQKNNLKTHQKKKTKLLVKIRTKKSKLAKNIVKIKEKALAQLGDGSGIEDYLKETFFESKGHLIKPVQGVLASRYGYYQDTKYKFKLINKGSTYFTKAAESVNSVFGGTVVFVGKLPGHRKSVVIDHGDHYYTVYGNLESIDVNQGEEIFGGQSLGTVGRFRSTNRPGLYFEIRHFSDAINPNNWFTKATLGESA